MKAVFLGLLFAVNFVYGQIPTDSTRTAQIPFVRVERIGEPNARFFFVFSTGYRNYVVRHDGFSEGSTATGLRKNFALKLGGVTRLERLYFAEYESDLLIEYEVTDGRADWGYVVRFDQKTMKLRWISPLNASDLGPGLIDGRELYVSGKNVLAKIDLQSGALGWQQSEFQQASEFGLPIVKGDHVIFQDDVEPSRSIQVDKRTGRIQKH